jgi:hypothetical protein
LTQFEQKQDIYENIKIGINFALSYTYFSPSIIIHGKGIYRQQFSGRSIGFR